MRPTDRPDAKSLTKDELGAVLGRLGEPSYRANQLVSWIFEKDAGSFDEMTNLPAALRERLASTLTLERAVTVKAERSKSDGTEKLLLEFADGARIEAVVLRDGGRTTGCISTQIGCRLGCSFCATGSMGFVRNLTTGEIVEEMMALRRHTAPERLDNLVFMGMGEPLDNYDAVMKAIRIANAAWGLGIGARHITVSTAGLVPGIRRLKDEGLQLNLAVSLNAPTQKLREIIMPVADKYKLDELLQAVADYTEATGRHTTLEYVLLKDINDTPELAGQLGTIARRLLSKVNVICYNEVYGSAFASPAEKTVEQFLARLKRRCPTVVRRISRGSDISAGCGQLCVEHDRAK